MGGHAGADQGMMREIYAAFQGELTGGVTFIDVSIDSHLMAFAAEESRILEGQPMKI